MRHSASLAIQLIERQSARYDPADTEDRYETRLRAMLDAKLKGEGVDTEEEVPAERSNVIDLMAALKKSLGRPSMNQTSPQQRRAHPLPRRRSLPYPTMRWPISRSPKPHPEHWKRRIAIGASCVYDPARIPKARRVGEVGAGGRAVPGAGSPTKSVSAGRAGQTGQIHQAIAVALA